MKFTDVTLIRTSTPANGDVIDINYKGGAIHVALDDATSATVVVKVGNFKARDGSTNNFVKLKTFTLDNTNRADGIVLETYDRYKYVAVDVTAVAGGYVAAVMGREL